MSTLYLDHRHATLRAENGTLVIESGEEKPRSIPLRLLERVVVQGEALISTGLLGQLAEAGVGLLTLSGRQSWRTAMLMGRPHRDLRIRLAQYQLALEEQARADWARRWVAAKLRGQERTLRQGLEERPELRYPLQQGMERLGALRARVPAARCLAEIRGLEGAGAAAYFPALAELFPPALGFERRNRRPPRDAVNAALSLAYTLLHFEAVRAAQAAGLDPLLGMLHDPAYGRESLACDLIEPLRPRVDGWVWRLFRGRTLRTEHFVIDKGACLLHKAGRRHFYEAWEDAARLYQLPLRGYCRLLVRQLRGLEARPAPVAADWSGWEMEEVRA